jgi:hypothetical protein
LCVTLYFVGFKICHNMWTGFQWDEKKTLYVTWYGREWGVAMEPPTILSKSSRAPHRPQVQVPKKTNLG